MQILFTDSNNIIGQIIKYSIISNPAGPVFYYALVTFIDEIHDGDVNNVFAILKLHDNLELQISDFDFKMLNANCSDQRVSWGFLLSRGQSIAAVEWQLVLK